MGMDIMVCVTWVLTVAGLLAVVLLGARARTEPKASLNETSQPKSFPENSELWGAGMHGSQLLPHAMPVLHSQTQRGGGTCHAMKAWRKSRKGLRGPCGSCGASK